MKTDKVFSRLKLILDLNGLPAFTCFKDCAMSFVFKQAIVYSIKKISG